MKTVLRPAGKAGQSMISGGCRRLLFPVLFAMLLLLLCACGAKKEKQPVDLEAYLLKEGLYQVSSGTELEKQNASSFLTAVGIDPLDCQQAVYYASDAVREKIFFAEMKASADLGAAEKLLKDYAEGNFRGIVDVYSDESTRLLCMIVSGSGTKGEMYANGALRSWIYLKQIF